MRNQRSSQAMCKTFIYPAGRQARKARFHSFPGGSVNWYPAATLLFPDSILGAISRRWESLCLPAPDFHNCLLPAQVKAALEICFQSRR